MISLPDLLPPSCEGSLRSSGRQSKRRGWVRGREVQVPAELEPGFLSWLWCGLVLGWQLGGTGPGPSELPGTTL